MLEIQESITSLINNPKINIFLKKGNKIIKGTKNKVEAIKNPEEYIKGLLKSAGITVGGNNPGDIQVNNPNFYKRVIFGGSLALGESYMDGWWDCNELDIFFEKVLDGGLEGSNSGLQDLFLKIKASLTNMQTRTKSYKVIDEHYNIGNEVYEIFLDELMLYTCAYYKTGNETLEEAQENKLDLIAKKLGLKPGMKVLDIGCGWGKVAKYMADKYNVDVIGITLSEEQYKYAKENYDNYKVIIKIMDYRDLGEDKFDAIYTIGMTEHVGPKNYSKFAKKVDESLKTGGKFLWHTIGSNKSMTNNNTWFNKYIFPNGVAASQKQMATSIENTDLLLEDSHNFGPDYDKTLMEWYNRFKNGYSELSEKNPEKYDESFYRMFEYYLLSCAGAFRGRHIQLYQNLYSKGSKEKYIGVR